MCGRREMRRREDARLRLQRACRLLTLKWRRRMLRVVRTRGHSHLKYGDCGELLGACALLRQGNKNLTAQARYLQQLLHELENTLEMIESSQPWSPFTCCTLRQSHVEMAYLP